MRPSTRLPGSIAPSALRADARHLDAVRRHPEPVRVAEPRQPRVEVALVELDDAVAALADQVVVVSAAAQAVAGLARAVRERVDSAALGQRREGAVDGCEADALALRAQAIVDLLRGRAVGLGARTSSTRDPLGRRADPEAASAERGRVAQSAWRPVR